MKNEAGANRFEIKWVATQMVKVTHEKWSRVVMCSFRTSSIFFKVWVSSKQARKNIERSMVRRADVWDGEGGMVVYAIEESPLFCPLGSCVFLAFDLCLCFVSHVRKVIVHQCSVLNRESPQSVCLRIRQVPDVLIHAVKNGNYACWHEAIVQATAFTWRLPHFSSGKLYRRSVSTDTRPDQTIFEQASKALCWGCP